MDLAPTTTPLLPLARSAQALLLVLLPHGGQSHARRNAWAGMSGTAATSRQRRQAQAALDTAEQRAHDRGARQGGTGSEVAAR